MKTNEKITLNDVLIWAKNARLDLPDQWESIQQNLPPFQKPYITVINNRRLPGQPGRKSKKLLIACVSFAVLILIGGGLILGQSGQWSGSSNTPGNHYFFATAVSTATTAGESEKTTTAAASNITSKSGKVYVHGYTWDFSSVAEIVEKSDAVFVGEVYDQTIRRMDLTKEGYVPGEGHDISNVSSFYIRVEKTFKGSFQVNEQIKIDERCGGEVDGFSEIYDPPLASPDTGSRYVFFIIQPKGFPGKEYFENMFISPPDGFVEIQGETIVPQEYTSVFKPGNYNAFIEEITKCVKDESK